MVIDYKSRKNEVLASYDTVEKLIAELQNYAKEINLPDPTERISSLLSDIRSKAEKVKADRFNIMIAGESKSGKSTFINAYLGVELLPMDVKQCTSAIVEIKWGKNFTVRATYADGRTEEINGDEEARSFLKKNAALDDEYRDIPVPTINSEILVKSGLRSRAKGGNIVISDSEVEAMLRSSEVQGANIYNLPDYNERIKAYINAKKNNWQDIVTKIEIMFPFGEDLRGIEIIDSPGVCARGGVAEITSNYIENADAIIFLKPVIGQSLESTQFSQFMETASVERNKNALFLVLTHIAAKNDADLRRLEEEAQKQFSSKLDKRNILFVDSKAELFAKKFSNIKDIEGELRKLNREGTLDDFVLKAYTETNGLFGNGDSADFIKKLQEKSRFTQIYQSLEIFGRKAHYILLSSLLESIYKLYGKLWNDMNSNIEMFKQKAEDPTELAKKIAELKQDIDNIQNKMSRGVTNVVRRFRGEEGMISTKAEFETTDFLEVVGKINPGSETAFNELEKHTKAKIKQYEDLTKQLQVQVVAEFDKELVELTDKSSIHYDDLKPDFTDETFERIKRETKAKAYEDKTEPGGCFKKSHTYSVYMQNKHFDIVKKNVLNEVEITKNKFIDQLGDFVDEIRSKYIAELAKNARAKEEVLDSIMEAKATAEQIKVIIERLSDEADKFASEQTNVEKIKGGISKYVQYNN
ncbi:MAG: dynamin family protein [Monoglobales bacterium]